MTRMTIYKEDFSIPLSFKEENSHFVKTTESYTNLKFNTFNKNEFTFSDYRTRNISHLVSLQNKSKQISKDTLDNLFIFEEILNYSLNFVKLKDDYFSQRIRKLKELCDLEDDYDLSLRSLKTLCLFLGSLENISKPNSLTVSEDGLFYMRWKKDKENGLTVRFKENYFVDYVIFQPSLYINKRIILNNSMYVLDLIDYLDRLKIELHHQ
ncbi:MAG: hypothetical protein J7647_30725 [Cyanobacteria bacterium SBLK]|nr:hypothetical protein [Cyanobacteria bacterium SBLK]